MTGSLNALGEGRYVFIESTAEGREGYFYQMCKEAQANKDSGKKLSLFDFRFHFFPWWGHRDYRIDSQNLVTPEHLSSYFNALERQINDKLESEQRAWYVKRAITQGEDMKREFPSTLMRLLSLPTKACTMVDKLLKQDNKSVSEVFTTMPMSLFTLRGI